MRKIEKDMITAIRSKKSVSLGNTVVNVAGETLTEVFLFGHHIADVFGNGVVNVNVGTLREFPTATTKSRLRALGVDVATRKGVTFLNGKEV